ncbi:hypothetical protein FA95DRAFT_1555906 [Auriscalpium vulgare]|uniref:Uncharacterized protein n=1 Tax=Auriscalpium vulgare TaxID=40419 RepID=A0ACB8S1Q4_9AGAM|nr:hypothetical protein FA95DRAFT_1555906 [Auriscalpium vulgare]
MSKRQIRIIRGIRVSLYRRRLRRASLITIVRFAAVGGPLSILPTVPPTVGKRQVSRRFSVHWFIFGLVLMPPQNAFNDLQYRAGMIA